MKKNKPQKIYLAPALAKAVEMTTQGIHYRKNELIEQGHAQKTEDSNFVVFFESAIEYLTK